MTEHTYHSCPVCGATQGGEHEFCGHDGKDYTIHRLRKRLFEAIEHITEMNKPIKTKSVCRCGVIHTKILEPLDFVNKWLVTARKEAKDE